MSPSPSPSTGPADALQELRRRICLTIDGDVVLHEGALATQFGMSRTPVRQILQRLSYERLVEVRSGVGTIALALDMADRPRDERTHRVLLKAIAATSPRPLSDLDRLRFVALETLVASSKRLSLELHFEVRSELFGIASSGITDPMVLDA